MYCRLFSCSYLGNTSRLKVKLNTNDLQASSWPSDAELQKLNQANCRLLRFWIAIGVNSKRKSLSTAFSTAIGMQYD